MLLDLRSLYEGAAVAEVGAGGGSFGHVVSDSFYPRPFIIEEPENIVAILALFGAGALTEDEFAVFLAA